MIRVVYGEGGYCEQCDPSHDHPLHNITSSEVVPDPQPTPEELARQSALDKLKKLGLTEAEALAIVGIQG